jgi:hypothetical protein
MMFIYGAVAFITKHYSIANLPYINGPKTSFVLGAICFVLAFMVYIMSLPAHARFGEFFKSIFDQYRSKLVFDDVVKEVGKTIGDLNLGWKKSRKERNQIAWRYLRWHLIRDESSGQNMTVGEWKARNSPTCTDSPTGQQAKTQSQNPD